MEYGVLVALVCVLLIGALKALSSSAGGELADRGGSIGNPIEPGLGTTTTSVGGPPATTTTTTTTPPYVGTVQGSCAKGAGKGKDTCSFSLNPDPAPTVPVWTIEPPSGFSGAPPSVVFTSPGSRTVRALVGTVSVQRIVSCALDNQNDLNCTT